MDIKKYREQLRMSQSELARTCGLAQSSISYIEQGQKSPNINTAVKLADVFNISVDELVRS